MHNSRGTLAVLFGTIQALLLSITKLFSQVDEGADMLSVAIQDASKRQKIRSTLDMKDYAQEYAKEYAKRRATAELGVEQFRATSKRHAELYDEALQDAEEALNKRFEQDSKNKTQE